jgi:hypothetical protein
MTFKEAKKACEDRRYFKKKDSKLTFRSYAIGIINNSWYLCAGCGNSWIPIKDCIIVK